MSIFMYLCNSCWDHLKSLIVTPSVTFKIDLDIKLSFSWSVAVRHEPRSSELWHGILKVFIIVSKLLDVLLQLLSKRMALELANLAIQVRIVGIKSLSSVAATSGTHNMYIPISHGSVEHVCQVGNIPIALHSEMLRWLDKPKDVFLMRTPLGRQSGLLQRHLNSWMFRLKFRWLSNPNRLTWWMTMASNMSTLGKRFWCSVMRHLNSGHCRTFFIMRGPPKAAPILLFP